MEERNMKKVLSLLLALTMAAGLLVSCGGKAGAREHGKLRIEGKEYVVKDGDVIEFRFNV